MKLLDKYIQIIMDSLISIIVPVYKAEKFLDRCIESILSQTYSKWELLLINDGSPDRSGEICNLWCKRDGRIKVFHKENGGVGSARNLGLEHAEGVWVTFVDSDDWISSNYLDSFVKKLKYGRETIYLQGIQMFTIHKGLSPMFSYTNDFYSIKDHVDLFVDNRMLADGCPVAKLFNLKILKEYGIKFDETISINEDHLFVLTYYNYVDNVCTISDLSYYYYYDFTVPSLTKINHSYIEMQKVSTLMHNAYKTICTKLKLTYEEQLTLSPLFGPNQAMKSVLSCISNNMPISSFGICCEYLSKNFGYDFDNYDSSYKTYIKILSFKTSVKVKFYMIKFFSIFEQIINFIKYRIKLIVWHSHIKENKI